MATQEDRIASLLSKTQEARYEFLAAELQACFTAAECAVSELTRGDREAAERESHKAEDGYEAIVHFLAVLDAGEKRNRIEAEWNRLRERLDQLQEMLG